MAQAIDIGITGYCIGLLLILCLVVAPLVCVLHLRFTRSVQYYSIKVRIDRIA